MSENQFSSQPEEEATASGAAPASATSNAAAPASSKSSAAAPSTATSSAAAPASATSSASATVELKPTTAIKYKIKHEEPRPKRIKREFHQDCEGECARDDYNTLINLSYSALVTNVETFECSVCFMEIAPGEGVVLHNCLHSLCRECLAGSIRYSDTAMIKCPYANEIYSCQSHLQDREIKSLVTPDVYEKHLARSLALAESQACDSFHCKTPNCSGWCLYEDDVNMFVCPVCMKTNCLTCAAIHEGKNCRQYQIWLELHGNTSEETRKTLKYLRDMVTRGKAMHCTVCHIILMKKTGCDWIVCSMCKTEICWVTRGPRWGPRGHGDTSGGCKCKVNGVKCHPLCTDCH